MNRTHVRQMLGVLAALGAASWIDKLVTIEWAYPYCSVMDNGEAAAVFGFPLPYQEVVIAASATTSFIPWLYAVDLAVITLGVVVVLRPFVSRLAAWKPLLCDITMGTAAALLLGTAVLLETFGIWAGIALPISAFSGVDRYSTLRPVKVQALGRPRNCTASPFWYPKP